ncbi:MAG: S9 family peptidase [Candidatus Zhuqueibacterota bacterium]
MKKAIQFSIIVAALLCNSWITHAASKRAVTMADFYKIKTCKTPRISPNGRYVLYVVNQMDSLTNGYFNQIWIVPSEGGDTALLTHAGTSNHSPAWSFDNNSFAYVSNASGTSQIWIMDIPSGESYQVTDLPNGAWSPIWSPDGQKIAFLSETQFDGRNPKGLYDIKVYSHLRYRWWYDANRYDEGWRSHIFIVDLATNEIQQLTDGDFFDDEISFSPDGDFIAFTSNRTEDRENNIDTDVWIVPVNQGPEEKIFENTGPDCSPVWSPDGRYLAWRSTFRYNYESDNYDIMVKDLKSNEIVNVTQPFDYVVYDLKWHPNSKEIVFLAAEKGNFNLYSVSRKESDVEPLIEGRHRIRHWDMSENGEQLVFARSNVTRPDEIYLMPYKKRTMRRITAVSDSLVETVYLQDAIPVTFDGAHQTPVQGWYLTPPDFNPGRQKYPLVLFIHGGPQLMYSNQFTFEFQLLASRGYIVFYSNPRGSFGYGQQFTDDVNKNYGGSCYTDIMAGVDYMMDLGFVDSTKMGVTGLSFGGWMTAWIIGHTQRFSAAIALAPFVNMLSFYGTTDEQFFPEWDFGGHPYDESTRIVYEKNSPLNSVINFRTPTLILHGEADWRCPISEGEQLFTALKKMGVPAVLARFPNEPHVFEQPNHIEAALRMSLDWWDSYLQRRP